MARSYWKRYRRPCLRVRRTAVKPQVDRCPKIWTTTSLDFEVFRKFWYDDRNLFLQVRIEFQASLFFLYALQESLIWWLPMKILTGTLRDFWRYKVPFFIHMLWHISQCKMIDSYGLYVRCNTEAEWHCLHSTLDHLIDCHFLSLQLHPTKSFHRKHVRGFTKFGTYTIFLHIFTYAWNWIDFWIF